MDHDRALRQHLVNLLNSANAHLTFDAVITDWPVKLRGRTVTGVPYTAWQILEHMRIAQWDILEFSRNPKHISPEWPEGYWLKRKSPPDAEAWDTSVTRLSHRSAGHASSGRPSGNRSLCPHSPRRRPDHNAYHLGQLVMIKRLLGAWPTG